MNFVLCKFCFQTLEKGIITSSFVKNKSDLLISDIIRIHFSFGEKILNGINDDFICTSCFDKLCDFHLFYETVASNYGYSNSLENKEGIIFNEDANKLYEEQLIKIEPNEEDLNAEVNWMDQYEEPCSSNSTKTNQKEKKVPRKKKERSVESPSSENEEDKRIRETANMNCDLCFIGFSDLRDAQIHYKDQHNLAGYLTCCGKKFKQKCRLVDHVNAHYDLTFECSQCGKIFDTKSYLLKHLACHEADKQFHCFHCPKTFAKKFQVRNHLMSVHLYDNVKPEFKCPKEGCTKQFVNSARLKHHIDYTHASESSEICDICSKTFKTKHAVTEHRLIHFKRPEDRIKCEICGHFLSNMKTYKRHRKNHDTESLSNTCNYCGKVSPNLNALKKHIHYVHERLPSFHCRYCEKSFKRARNLIDHEASVHTLQELYSCSFCSKSFRNQSNMLTHRKKQHPDQYVKPAYMRDIQQ